MAFDCDLNNGILYILMMIINDIKNVVDIKEQYSDKDNICDDSDIDTYASTTVNGPSTVITKKRGGRVKDIQHQ